jgi:hypothetical protein
LPLNLESFCLSLATTKRRVDILHPGENNAESGTVFVLLVEISHHRYKLRRDVDHTPKGFCFESK